MSGLIDSITDSYVFGLEGFIIIAIIVGASAFISSFRKKVGGTYLIEQMKELDGDVYHLVSNVTLPELDQKIDHIVLSVYGVMVINRENYDGTIFGSEKDEKWRLEMKRREKPITNPLAKWDSMTPIIAEQFDLKEKDIHPIITFSNSAKLNVDKALIGNFRVCNYDQINEAIKSYHTPKLAKTKIAELVKQLEAIKQA